MYDVCGRLKLCCVQHLHGADAHVGVLHRGRKYLCMCLCNCGSRKNDFALAYMRVCVCVCAFPQPIYAETKGLALRHPGSLTSGPRATHELATSYPSAFPWFWPN